MSEFPRLITTEGNHRVEWNGVSLHGMGRLFYDRITNVNGGRFDSEDKPELGNLILAASCSSIYTGHSGVFSRSMRDAVNLGQIMGGTFNHDAEYRFFDDNGNLIGEAYQFAEYEEIYPGRLKANIDVKGSIDSPTDIVWSPGYAVHFRQIKRGVIEGVYGQTIQYESGRQFYAHVRRRYFYNNRNELPFDEIFAYKLRKLDVSVENARRIVDYRAVAFYAPAVGEHGSIEESNLLYEQAWQTQPELVVAAD